MKTLTQTKALKELKIIKDNFRKVIKSKYEHNAKNCLTCDTKGACCLDAHFVNVHITKLEAVAISKTLEKLSAEKGREIYCRAAETVEKYDLKTSGDTFSKTFACPLFEKETGCLVHFEGKPAPCLAHACYENQADLPPNELQEDVEEKIERLNKRTYKNNSSWLSLPVWLGLVNPSPDKSKNKIAQNNIESAR